MEVVFSAGMMIGGGLIAARGCFKNRMHTMILSHAVMALCTLALGLAPSFWLYLVAMGVLGISLPFFNTPSTVMIQEHVEEAYLGRVFSVMTMIFTSLMPLGMLLFGPLAEVVRIEWLLVVSGIILIALLPLVLMNKRLLEAGRKSESVSPSANPARSL
jgi:DHA3 family macrolide efflux protein-like MFS transporter